jgi:hypothetical protein
LPNPIRSVLSADRREATNKDGGGAGQFHKSRSVQ